METSRIGLECIASMLAGARTWRNQSETGSRYQAMPEEVPERFRKQKAENRRQKWAGGARVYTSDLADHFEAIRWIREIRG
jgi:hypothetical protein